ncbi:MAG: DUF1192 domain-containing protein [Alphaproteobacteria bacterium]|nr:DUF1192 domain-containing protein [Alphaproteobacteria bacterium]
MALADDDPFSTAPVKKPAVHEIGQSLDLLSVSEIDERIELLKAEILRLTQSREAKAASRLAADAFFKS